MAKTSTLVVENWASQTAFTLSAGVTTDGTNLVVPATSAYPSAWPSATYDLTGSSTSIQLVAPPNVDNGSVAANLSVQLDANNYLTIGWENNKIRVGVNVAGTANYYGYVKYDDYKHRWFRIRETSGTVYFETGPDGINFPHLIHSQTTPFAVTSISPYVNAGNWNSAVSPGSAIFGAMNPGTGVAGANQTAEPWQTVTLTGSGAGTWAQTDGTPVELIGTGSTVTFTAPPSMFTESLTFSYGADTTDVIVKRARSSVRIAGGEMKPIRLAVGQDNAGTPGVDATIRSSSTASIAYQDATNPINKPANVVEGDLLLLFATTDWGVAADFTPPAGFTQLFEDDKGSDLGKMFAAYKVATASEPASYTIAAAASGEVRADLYAIQDWSGNTAEIVAAGIVTASSLTHAAPTVTPATATGLLFSAAAVDNVGTWNWTHPTGMTEHYDARGPGNYTMQATASQRHNTTNPTGTRTWTLAGTSPTAQAGLVGNVIVPSKPATGGSGGVIFPAPYVPYEPPPEPTLFPATVRSTTTRTWSSSNTTNESMVIPTDAVAGDICIAYVMADTGTATEMGAPTGFTELTELVPSGGPRINVSYRVVQAGDPGTAFNLSSYPSGSDGAGILVCVKDWSGVTTEIAVISGQATRSGTSPNISVVAPSVTPKTTHGLFLSSIAMDEDNTSGKTWTFTPPSPMTLVQSMNNAGGWSGIGVGGETWAANTATGTRTWTVSTTGAGTIAALSSIVIPSKQTSGGGGGGTGSGTGDYTGGTGGDLTDVVEVTYNNGTKTSRYNLYASGLDWTKDVGLLIYCDGSGDWGIDNATDPYLMAGTNGLVAVAKRQNMILLTPFAPGDGCTDNDGVCWYLPSFDGTTVDQKIQWSRDLVDYIMGRYNIDKSRMVIAGYSSGAQWTTEYFGPRHAPAVMSDGLGLAISYGGQPIYASNYTTTFKQKVPFVWDVGDLDPAYQGNGQYDAQSGYDWYTANGFVNTDLIVVQGEDHDRTGLFGQIVEREIIKWVRPA